MNNYWILFIVLGIIVGLSIKWYADKKTNFRDLIEAHLNQNELKYISSTYPGLFRVGPFKMFEISIGKPQINNGTVQYEKTYYRIVALKTKNNLTREVWAKIETS